MKKSMTTVKMPKQIVQGMLEKIIKDGYGMRGKSRWITEAIEMFLNISNFEELVDIADDIDDVTEVVSLRLPEHVISLLDTAVVKVRRVYPAMEGVRSNIIRGSIMQKLIRG